MARRSVSVIHARTAGRNPQRQPAGRGFVCRLYRETGEKKFLEPALRAARQAVKRQQPDGSWFYGEHSSQRWIIISHWYNLGALRRWAVPRKPKSSNPSVRRGFEFYRTHFFRQDSAPKYFHDRVYPLDIHCVRRASLHCLNSGILIRAM